MTALEGICRKKRRQTLKESEQMKTQKRGLLVRKGLRWKGETICKSKKPEKRWDRVYIRENSE